MSFFSRRENRNKEYKEYVKTSEDARKIRDKLDNKDLSFEKENKLKNKLKSKEERMAYLKIRAKQPYIDNSVDNSQKNKSITVNNVNKSKQAHAHAHLFEFHKNKK